MSQEERIYVSEDFGIRLRQQSSARTSAIRNRGYSLLYFLSEAKVIVDETSLRVEPSCVVLLDPNRGAELFGSRITVIEVSLTASYLIDAAIRINLLSSGKLVSFVQGPHCDDARMDRILRDLTDEMQSENAGREEFMDALINQLAIYVLRNYSVLRAGSHLELSRVGIVDRRIRRAIELMESHLDRDLPVSELARAAYLSPFHFSRLFKKLMGTSPHAYLAILRSQKAQSLLAESDLSITDIATRVGYSGSSQFTKAFRDATGLSPRAFRNSVIGRRN